MPTRASRLKRVTKHRADALRLRNKKGQLLPHHVPTAASRARVFAARLEGMTKVEIAAELGMHRHTLGEQYATELAEAEAEKGDVAECAIYKQMKAGNTIATLFFLKCKRGWVEAQPGAPPPADVRPLHLTLEVVESPPRGDYDEVIVRPPPPRPVNGDARKPH
ncbi:hypothetical protein SAMN05519104_4334 [Rhizobiales bacterium GAS188]|nr:hypothetical protein SAMN05519104_4334 [Rhizobiales bacterium GAS188]